MPSTVEQISPTRVKLTVEIPFADLKPALEKAYRQVAGQISIPGFRKGKVPNALIDQRVGRGSVLQEAINEVVPDAYGRAVAEANIAPLGQPEVEITKLQDGDLVEFTAEVDVRPDFDLPDFSQVSVTVPNTAAVDALVDERVQLLRQRFASSTEVDREAQDGDVVIIDLVGSQDGEILPDATATGITYTIGSGGMLDGLDEAVTGLKAGEEATFTSELLGGPQRGQETDLLVTVQKVSEQELPEVDDEFAQLVSQFDTVDEMRADLADSATRMARLDQATEARDKVLEDFLELTTFDVPAALVTSEETARREQVENQLQQAGLTIETYLENNEDEAAKTPEEFWTQLGERSEQSLRAQILLDKIADDRKIGVDQQDLTALIIRKAQQNNTSPEQEAQHMMDHNHMADWMGEVRRSKALAMLVEAATITDEDGNAVDLSRLASDGTYVDEGVLDSEDAEPAEETVTD